MNLSKYKETLLDVVGVITIYSMIVLGVISLNARMAEIEEQQKSVTEAQTHVTQNSNYQK